VPKSPRNRATGRPGHNYRSQYGVIVICRDERHQRSVYESLAAKGLKVKVVVT
jgi:hypothetical protein